MTSESTPPDLVSLLARRVAEAPDRTAYRYLGRTEGSVELTRAGLRDAAYAVAARLADEGAQGERVLLLFPPGLEFVGAFFGCMSAGAIPVPAPPPNPLKPQRSLQRLASIVKSAEPTFALTLSNTLSALRPALAEASTFDAVRWLCTDELPQAPADFTPHRPDRGDVALIQFTSGSTSEPKGAALTHENVMTNASYFDEGWDHGPDSVLINWLPAFHDLGLVYGILTPLWGGFPGIQMSPIDVIQRPSSWLEAISTHRATHTGGPNFIYELCVRKVRPEVQATLDLSSWRMALDAAEPVRAETLQRFAERFAPQGFRASAFSPGYGMSEATCKVSAVAAADPPTVLALEPGELERHVVEQASSGQTARAVVGCGRPGRDVRVEIVDPESCVPVDAGHVGEIWVSGVGVAHSYWGQPSETERQLRARLQGSDGPPFLRTGDLGFLHEGELFVTGRCKDMIIVRGENHYPQDIEYTVQDAHPGIRAGCSAAFAVEEDGEERLAIVAEVERQDGAAPFRPEEVTTAITRAVAEEHGLRAHRVVLIRTGTIPKTTSGKIQRRACRQMLLAGRLAVLSDGNTSIAPPRETTRREDLRARIAAIVSDAAEIPLERLRPDESFYDLGIDSLTGVNISYEIGILVGREVPPELVSERDTIDKLVDYALVTGVTA